MYFPVDVANRPCGISFGVSKASRAGCCEAMMYLPGMRGPLFSSMIAPLAAGRLRKLIADQTLRSQVSSAVLLVIDACRHSGHAAVRPLLG